MKPSLYITIGLFVFCAPVLGNDIEVFLSSGEKISGNLADLDNRNVKISGIEKPIDLTDVAEIRFLTRNTNSNVPGAFAVQGQDQTRLRSSQILLNDDVITFSMRDGSKIAQIQRELIRSIQLDNSVEKDSWNRTLSMNTKGDGLVVSRENRLDVIDGVIKSLKDDSVSLLTNGREVNVKLSKLAGLIFFQPNSSKSQPKLVALDVNGNQFGGNSIRLDGQTFIIENKDGKSIKVPDSRIVKIDFTSGNFLFLDTIKPVLTSWEPFVRTKTNDADIGKLIQFARDKKPFWNRNQAFGKPLAIDEKLGRTKENLLGRKVFPKGISIRGGSRLVFEMPENADYFVGEIGIQAGAHGRGSVDLEILVDSKSVFQRRITTNLDKAIAVKIPAQGQRIAFHVGYGGDNDIGDIAVIGNARFRIGQ